MFKSVLVHMKHRSNEAKVWPYTLEHSQTHTTSQTIKFASSSLRELACPWFAACQPHIARVSCVWRCGPHVSSAHTLKA